MGGVEGVEEARFSYEAAEGFVTFDTTVTTVAEIVSELEEMTAFSATERADEGLVATLLAHGE